MKYCKFLFLSALICLSGCQTSSQYQNSSVVDFLYPKQARQEITPTIPRLTLPLRVGVAFTPATYRDGNALPEASKIRLLDDVGEHFRGLDFVKSIEVIPSAYLRSGGGFENLDQLKRMFNIDVVALVSYDQTSFSDEGLASIAYWTIVGAYIVPAEKNKTHTMLDAVLYDINSRSMLFRAPGLSSVKSNATLINRTEQVREDSQDGFEEAAEDLVTNLGIQLELFREKVKDTPDEYQIAKREGYKGGGATEFGFLILVVLFGAAALRRR